MLKLTKTSLLAAAILATSLSASDILVTVNGKNITKQDAEQLVATQAPQMTFAKLDPNQQKVVVGQLIEEVLFTELALKEGIDKKPEFQRNMEKLKDRLLLSMWMKTQMDNAIVSDSEAKDFYDKNRDKFLGKDSAHARHILVKTKQEAQEIIDVLKSLKGEALKAKFIELAKEKSTGPTGPKGGDLGTFTKEQMVPEFSDAVWTLEKGQITKEPVQTQFGFHVIYLEEKTTAKPTPYKEVKEGIINSLKQKQFGEKITEIAKELKKKAQIQEMTTTK
jgi:parvulin-like peptidyl-prolyl isomerase